MDVNATTQTLINVLVIVVIPTLTKAAVDYMRLKIQGTRIEQAGQIVLDAVDQTNQTFADQLRKDGTFTGKRRFHERKPEESPGNVGEGGTGKDERSHD